MTHWNLKDSASGPENHGPEPGGGYETFDELWDAMDLWTKLIWTLNLFLLSIHIFLLIKHGYLRFSPFHIILSITFTILLFIGTLLENMHLHLSYEAQFDPLTYTYKNVFHMSPMWLIQGTCWEKENYPTHPWLSVLVAFFIIVLPLLQLYFLNIVSLCPKLKSWFVNTQTSFHAPRVQSKKTMKKLDSSYKKFAVANCDQPQNIESQESDELQVGNIIIKYDAEYRFNRMIFIMSSIFDYLCKYSLALFLHFIMFVQTTWQVKKRINPNGKDNIYIYILFGISNGAVLLTCLSVFLVLYSFYIKYYFIKWYSGGGEHRSISRQDHGQQSIQFEQQITVDLYADHDGKYNDHNVGKNKDKDEIDVFENFRCNYDVANKQSCNYLYWLWQLLNMILWCLAVFCFIQLVVVRLKFVQIVFIDETGIYRSLFEEYKREFDLISLANEFLKYVFDKNGWSYALFVLYYLIIIILPIIQIILLLVLMIMNHVTFKSSFVERIIRKICWIVALYNCLDVFIFVLIIQYYYDPNIINFVVQNTWVFIDAITACIESGIWTPGQCNSMGLKLNFHTGFYYIVFLAVLLHVLSMLVIFVKCTKKL